MTLMHHSKNIIAQYLFSAIFFGLLLPSMAFAQLSPNKVNDLANYIQSLQYGNPAYPNSLGAIQKALAAPSYYDGGAAYYKVEPYFAHNGVRGLLHTGFANRFIVARNWFNWYLAHLNSHYNCYNYYYNSSGSIQTACPPASTGIACYDIDAQDSDAAVFCGIAYEYFLYSGDTAWFNNTGVRTKLEGMMNFVIDSLIQNNHLSIAKTSWAVQYTMDNSEVFWGLKSMAAIENNIYQDATMAAYYNNKADLMQQAIQTLLYNSGTDSYKWALNMDISPLCWYGCGDLGGVTATVFPQLFGIDSYCNARSIDQRTTLNNSFDGSPNTDWTSQNVETFIWANIGYTFAAAGDTLHGFAQADYAIDLFQTPYSYPPCYVSDAGYLLMTAFLKYNPYTSIEITPNDTACVGSSIILTSPHKGTQFSCQWLKDGLPISGATHFSYAATLSGTYSLSLINNGCPILSNAVSLYFTPAPAPLITGNATVCTNTPQTYSVPAIAGHTYTWTVTGGTILSGQGTNSITVQWASGTVGTVQVIEGAP